MSIPLSVVLTPQKKFSCTTKNVSSGGKMEYFSSNGNNNISSQQRRRNSSGFAYKDNYAGAKFSDHPPATQLPKPPRHWVYNCKPSSGEKTVHLQTTPTQNREK